MWRMRPFEDTPLVLAKRNGHQEVIEVLERCNKSEQDRQQVLQEINQELKKNKVSGILRVKT